MSDEVGCVLKLSVENGDGPPYSVTFDAPQDFDCDMCLNQEIVGDFHVNITKKNH